MGRLSDLQLANINDSCSNGFQLNVKKFILEDEVELVKHRDIDENTRLVYKVYYEIKYRKKRERGRFECLVPTNRHIVVLKICKWTRSESLYAWVDTKDSQIVTSTKLTVDRKSMKFLTKLTHKLTNEFLDELIE